ncbi:hypothetical protein C8J56DRAFT_1094501 [Mycena floridula]|nr:hypothetical protein C8J56DRAFT_1094501 [Mycena floridula]
MGPVVWLKRGVTWINENRGKTAVLFIGISNSFFAIGFEVKNLSQFCHSSFETCAFTGPIFIVLYLWCLVILAIGIFKNLFPHLVLYSLLSLSLVGWNIWQTTRLARSSQLVHSLRPSAERDILGNEIYSLKSSAMAVGTFHAFTAVLVLSLSLVLRVFKAPHFRRDAIAALYALFQLQVFILPARIALGHLFDQEQIGFGISVSDAVIWLSFRRRNKSLIAMAVVMSFLVIVATIVSFTFAIIATIYTERTAALLGALHAISMTTTLAITSALISWMISVCRLSAHELRNDAESRVSSFKDTATWKESYQGGNDVEGTQTSTDLTSRFPTRVTRPQSDARISFVSTQQPRQNRLQYSATITSMRSNQSSAPTERQIQLRELSEALGARIANLETALQTSNSQYNDAMADMARLRAEHEWLRDHHDSDWALGLTDQRPPSYGSGN